MIVILLPPITNFGIVKKALIIFVRHPQSGKVKTRLAATVGDANALAIYKELLQHTWQIALETAADKFVFYVDEIEENDLWDGKLFFKRVQVNDNLGEKMKAAFNELFAEGYGKVVIIGSDCLELTASVIRDAFDELDINDVVIGPANDGGYYLLGLKKMMTFLFENKAWSTGSVYKETIADIEKSGLSFSALPMLTDVDTEEDWQKSKKADL